MALQIQTTGKAKPKIVIDLSNLPHVVNDAYWPHFGTTTRNLILRGGAGSGKSVFAAQKLVIRCMYEANSWFKHHFICFRKVQRTCKTSVFAQLREAVHQLGVEDLWEPNKSELTLTFKPNGAQCRCMGLDDQEKLKSIVGMTGAWMEEFTEFLPQDYNQVNLRLRGQTAFYKQIIGSFNPIDVNWWGKKRFYDTLQRPGQTTTVLTTFEHNRFLDDEYIQELRSYEILDPYVWQVYGLGDWGVVGNVIYRPFDDSAWPDLTYADETFYGLDFGYNAPTALTRIDAMDLEYYLTEEIYERKLTNADLIAMMDSLGISRDAPIYADAAEPGRIEEIARAGYNIYPADKGPGSVGHGISLVKSLRLHTKPGNVNLNREVTGYKWREDKNGNVLDEPVPVNDHAMDSMRYGLYTHLRERLEGGDVVHEFDVEDVDILPDLW